MKQRTINILNLFIAVIALIISAPTAINQINEIRSRNTNFNTERVNFTPPKYYTPKVSTSDGCISSGVSIRSDAYRCFGSKFIEDPCFVSESLTEGETRLYCPVSWKPSPQDTVINIKSTLLEANSAEEEDTAPWLFVLNDGTECKLHTGAAELAYGDKGNNYTCNSKDITSVTFGRTKGDDMYFECKHISESVFKECKAKYIVY